MSNQKQTTEKEKALGIICRAYLKQTNAKTYDLRSFEYQSGNDTVVKVDSLIRLINPNQLSEAEKEAYNLLKDIKRLKAGSVAWLRGIMDLDRFQKA